MNFRKLDLNREVNIFLAFSLITAAVFVVAAWSTNLVSSIKISSQVFPAALTNERQLPPEALAKKRLIVATNPSPVQSRYVPFDPREFLNADPSFAVEKVSFSDNNNFSNPIILDYQPEMTMDICFGAPVCRDGLHNVYIKLSDSSGQHLLAILSQITLINPTHDISYLAPSQVKNLEGLNSAKVKAIRKNGVKAADSSQSGADLSNTLKKYNVPTAVQAELDDINAGNPGWTANYNKIFNKSHEYQEKILGVKLDYKVLNKFSKNSGQSINLKDLNPVLRSSGSPVAGSAGSALPGSFDWRNVGGKNYITPVKDQGGCGSCWAFGAMSALEGKINAYYNNPLISQDLSEQDLVSCDAYSNGCNGAYDYQIKDIFSNYLVNTGIAQEFSFPYTSGASGSKGVCSSKASNWNLYAWKTDSSLISVTLGDDKTANINAIKQALVNNGPVEVGMYVYTDFLSYAGGIYYHTSNSIAGGHAVTIVGYGISPYGLPYWIVKNSWGPDWGENGYFRIAMGDSMIDQWFAYVPGIPLYANAGQYTKLCTDNDSDGYCYWGLGTKPSSGCPSGCSANTIEDCDDSNASLGNNNCGKLANAGEVDVTSSPSNAKVYVMDDSTGNYVFVGSTPATLYLQAGLRQIKVSYNGEYFDSTNTVNVSADSQTTLNAVLAPDPKYSSVFVTDGILLSEMPIASIYGQNILYPSSFRDPDFYNFYVDGIFSYNTYSKQKSVVFKDNGSRKYLPVYGPKMYGNIIISANVSDDTVFEYNTSAGITKIISDTGQPVMDSVPSAGSGTAAWLYALSNSSMSIYFVGLGGSDWYFVDNDIIGYDLVKDQQFIVKKSPVFRGADGSYSSPQAFGNYIVWSEEIGGAFSIHLYNISSKTENIIGPANGRRLVSPHIWNNYVAWVEGSSNGAFSGSGQGTIKLYDISTGLTKNIFTGENISPYMNMKDNKIVWSAAPDQKYFNVYMYDLLKNQAFQLTNNNTDQLRAADVSDYAAVWEKYSDQAIYMRDITNISCSNTKCIGGCGSANGASFYSIPTANFCDDTSIPAVSGTGPWTWSCPGLDRGTSVSCSANKKTDGVCGSATVAIFTSAPTANLCSVGTASTVGGVGPWTWSCNGLNGGVNASCSAYNKITDGACGSFDGGPATPTANLCSVGTASAVSKKSAWMWTCSSPNGGKTTNCLAGFVASGGVCGPANGQAFLPDQFSAQASVPANLCSAGTPSTVSGTGPWTWTCQGNSGGTVSCQALPVVVKVNGACGSANGTSLSSAPTANLCSAGTASAASGTGPWTWSCNGSGGGTNASCSASITSLGYCLVRDMYTSLPVKSAPDVGKGYSKMAKPGVSTISGLQSACSASDYSALLKNYCASNSNTSQQEVVTYDANGNYKSTGCGAFGCNYISCPAPQPVSASSTKGITVNSIVTKISDFANNMVTKVFNFVTNIFNKTVPKASVQMKLCGKFKFDPAKEYCADAIGSIVCSLGENLCGTKCYSSSVKKCASAEKSIVCPNNQVLCGNRCMKSCGKTVGSRGAIASGGACTADDDCTGDLICVNRVCKEAGTVPNGGSCTVNGECAGDFFPVCIRGKCSDGSLGSACKCNTDLGDTCDSADYDIYCNTSTGICEALKGPGEKCGQTCDADVEDCNINSADFGCIRGKCSDGSVGMLCDANYDSCDLEHNYCKNGVCASFTAQGEACASNEQCANGSTCINKVCSPGVVGAPCDSNYNCDVSNYCNSQGICTAGAKLGEPCDRNSNLCAQGLNCLGGQCFNGTCYDSDGLDYNTKGTVSDTRSSYHDVCYNGQKVSEQICNDKGEDAYVVYGCLSGFCNDGACRATVCGDGWLTNGEACDKNAIPTGCPAGNFCTSDCKCQQSGDVVVSNLIPNGGSVPLGNVTFRWRASSTVTDIPDANTLYCNIAIFPNIGVVGNDVAIQNGGTGTFSYNFTNSGQYTFQVACHPGNVTGIENIAISPIFTVGTVTPYVPPHKPICGDGTVNGNEQCDKTDLGGKTCATYGYSAGILSCNSNCTINKNGCSTYLPLLRYYNGTTGDHAYSTNPGNGFTPTAGYAQEPTQARLSQTQLPGMVPVYSLRIGTSDYSISINGGNPLTVGQNIPNTNIYVIGIEGYAYKTSQPGTIPLYRLYNSTSAIGDHGVVTNNPGVAPGQIFPSSGGYTYEGIEAYVFPY